MSVAVCLLGAGVAGAAPAARGVSAAAAGASPGLTVTASGSTTVGYQVFANVNFTAAANPTGSLTFQLFGPGDTSCAFLPLFTSTVAVTGMSVNSERYTTTVAGTYHWVASYSGDANNAASGPTPCSGSTSAVVVSRAFPTVSLSAQAPAGGAIQASAFVNGYATTGSLTFILSAPGDTFCSNTMFSSTVAVSGTGTYTSAGYAFSVGGQYKWRVSYTGDANNVATAMTPCLDPNAAVTVTAPVTTAHFTNLVDGQANVDTSQPFTWPSVPGAGGYYVMIGTTYGGFDLFLSGVLPASQTSVTVPPLPAGPLYALLFTQANGVWVGYQAVTFTAIPLVAGLTSPTNTATNVNPTAPLTWSTVPGVGGYAVWITDGTTTYEFSPALPASQSSLTPPPLPAGVMLYAFMFTLRNGTWTYQDISFTTAGGAAPTESGQAASSAAIPCLGTSTVGKCKVTPSSAAKFSG